MPVEQKSGGGWLGWLLGLLVLAAAIWLLVELFDSDEPEYAELDAVEEVEPIEAEPVTAITDASILMTAPMQYVGRDVRLNEMRVTEVIGDKTFYVTPISGDTDRRFFVVLDQEMNEPPPGVEGRYDVTEGQIITIMGEVMSLEGKQWSDWGITEEEAQKMKDDAIYLHANRLDITRNA